MNKWLQWYLGINASVRCEQETGGDGSGGGDGFDFSIFEDLADDDDKAGQVEAGAETEVVEEEGDAEEEEPEPDLPEGTEPEETDESEVVEDETVEEEAEEEKQKEAEPEEEQQPEEGTEDQHTQALDAYFSELEKKFALSEDDANLMLTEPENVIPRLGAEMMREAHNMMSSMMNELITALPQLVQNSNQQVTIQQERESKFFESNPELKDIDRKEVSKVIEQLAPVIKAQMPNATAEERLNKLGQTVKAVLGVESKAKSPAPKKRAVPPHTPAARGKSSTPPSKPPLSDEEEFIQGFIEAETNGDFL